MTTHSIKVGIVQENPIVGDISGNTVLAVKAINELKKDNPDIILFTEMFLTGYPPEDLLLRSDLLDSIDVAIEELAHLSENLVNWAKTNLKEDELIGAQAADEVVLNNAYLNINYSKNNFGFTIGSIYDQFGSGLILRTWEDRQLGINNSIWGLRSTYGNDKVNLKLLAGWQKKGNGMTLRRRVQPPTWTQRAWETLRAARPRQRRPRPS